MKLTVIMPVYSETESVRRIVEDITTRLRPHLFEIIFMVSPRSSPESLAVCTSIAEHNQIVRMVMQSEKPGFGQAYREAFPHAKGDAILMLDADGEFDLSSIPPMIEAILRGADVAVACRWMPGGGVEGYGTTTYLANRAFQIFLRILFRTRLRDLTFGFKMLRAEVVRAIPWEGTTHELAMETTLKPLRYGYRVVEVPSFWRKRREGESKNKSLLWRFRRYMPLVFHILKSPPPPGTPAYLSAGRQVQTISCPLCGDAPTRVVGRRGIVAKGGPVVPVRNVMCQRCGLIFQNPRPDAAELHRLTSEYTESRHGFDTPEDLERHLAELNVRGKAAGIRAFLGEMIFPGAKILEVGCGPGVVLRYLRDEAKCVVAGVEPSAIAAVVAERNGIPVFIGTFEEYAASAPAERFDAILLHHVLEHVPDPIASLSVMRGLLTPRGVLYVEVPDVMWFAKPVNHFFDAMHLWNFTSGTLRAMLARGGFKIIRRNSGKHYRIQVIAAPMNHAAQELPARAVPVPSPRQIASSLRRKRIRDAARSLRALFRRPS